MKVITLNNQLGPRSLSHLNLLLARVGEKDLIVEFRGESIPGVARVVKEDYTENGKWSHSTWQVELAEGIAGFTFSQDWETGRYLERTWGATFERFRQAVKAEVSDEAIERFVRAYFRNSINGRKAIEEMDASEGVLSQPSGPVLAELLAAQEGLVEAQAEHDQVAAEVASIEQAEIARTEAAALRER
ncbi:MAG: hypothetical protein EOM21_21405, partial [Gammaproteobacteria bacterium]|nr:hypothetical protein [Gammaproteobacteria bacterium]